jgi:hypothetical protein
MAGAVTVVASENLDSCVSMVQPAKDWMRNNVSEPLDLTRVSVFPSDDRAEAF